MKALHFVTKICHLNLLNMGCYRELSLWWGEDVRLICTVSSHRDDIGSITSICFQSCFYLQVIYLFKLPQQMEGPCSVPHPQLCLAPVWHTPPAQIAPRVLHYSHRCAVLCILLQFSDAAREKGQCTNKCFGRLLKSTLNCLSRFLKINTRTFSAPLQFWQWINRDQHQAGTLCVVMLIFFPTAELYISKHQCF